MAINEGQKGSHEGALASKNIVEKKVPDQNYIAAPNIVKDGFCNHCSEEVSFVKDNAIKCHTCGYMFHAVGCSVENYNVSSPSSFTNHLLPAVTKATKSYKNKFGRFLFICDFCATEKEEATQTEPGMKNVYVDRKIEELKQSFANELSEVKDLLKTMTAPSKDQSCPQPPVPSNSATNPWDDSQRTERLRSMVLIKNDDDGKPINKSILEESCVQSKIGIVNHQ